jgi:molecular chaperone Hsp33
MAKDRIEKFLDDNGLVRASVIVATDVVEEMRSILDTYDIATIMLGRSMMGALLMAAHLKEGENVGIYFRGNGPMKLIFAEGDHSGATRAYTPEPHVQLPLKNNKLDFGAAIGIGLFEVVRGVAYSHNLQKGAVEIRTGQVGDDIAYYLYQSHQIPSLVALSVELNPNGTVKTAGGILIELMPGAKENEIQKIEERMKNAKSLDQLISQGAKPEELIEQYLADFKMLKMDFSAHIRYECRCSKERVKNALYLLGHEELDDLIKDQNSHEVSCDFCGKKYNLTVEEIQGLRDRSYKNSLN